MVKIEKRFPFEVGRRETGKLPTHLLVRLGTAGGTLSSEQSPCQVSKIAQTRRSDG